MLFSKKFHGKVNPETLLCFLFGVIFIAVTIFLSLNYSEPTAFQLRVFITVLSLAGAGIAAIIPGLIDISVKKRVRITGAMAIFTLIYFNHPDSENTVAKIAQPLRSSVTVAGHFLQQLDKGEVEKAYQLFIAAGHYAHDINLFRQVYQNIRLPLGNVIERKIVNVEFAKSLPDYPDGHYDLITWQSRFSADQQCRYEDIVMKASPDRTWGMSSYYISDSVPCG